MHMGHEVSGACYSMAWQAALKRTPPEKQALCHLVSPHTRACPCHSAKTQHTPLQTPIQMLHMPIQMCGSLLGRSTCLTATVGKPF